MAVQQQTFSRNPYGYPWLFARRSLLLSFSLLWTSLSIVAAQDLQCPDGQVLMEVSGSRKVSVTSPSYEEDYFEYTASNDDELATFCVPADKCLVVKLDTKRIESEDDIASSVSIIYDDQPISLIGSFSSSTSYAPFSTSAFYVEVGESCKVTCEEGQVLLEIEAVTSQSNSRSWLFDASMDLVNHFDWQVIDDTTNEVIRTCPPSAQQPNNANGTIPSYSNGCYWSVEGLFRDRVCVPKDGCYRLVAGESAANLVQMFQVTMSDEVLHRTEYFQFESVLLLHAESPSSCSSVHACESESDLSQEEMEVFIFRNEVNYEDAQNLTWSTDYAVSGQWVSDVNTFVAGDRPLQYKRICIPGCALFYVNDQLLAGVYSFFNRETAMAFRVQANGIIHAEEDHSTPNQLPWGLQMSEVIGGSCQTSQACQVRGQGQSLVQVDVRYRPDLLDDFDSLFSTSDGWTIVTAPNKRAEKDYMDNSESAHIVYGTQGFPVKEPGKHYRNQLCLGDEYFQEESDTRCIALEMRRDENHLMESFSVSVNGLVFDRSIDCSGKVPLAYRRMCSWAYIQEYSSLSVEWTPLNGNCKKKGIPGIVTAATVGGVLLIAGLCHCMNRRYLAARKNPKNPSVPPAADPHDTVHSPNPAVAVSEPVAIPLGVSSPSTNPVLPVVEASNGNNPQTTVGIESSQVPTSTPQAHTVTVSDEEDFA